MQTFAINILINFENTFLFGLSVLLLHWILFQVDL
jgi:hypothetical protein